LTSLAAQSHSEPPNLKAKPGEPQADLAAWLAQNSSSPRWPTAPSRAVGNTIEDYKKADMDVTLGKTPVRVRRNESGEFVYHDI